MAEENKTKKITTYLLLFFAISFFVFYFVIDWVITFSAKEAIPETFPSLEFPDIPNEQPGEWEPSTSSELDKILSLEINWVFSSFDYSSAVSLAWTKGGNPEYYQIFRQKNSFGFSLLSTTTAKYYTDKNGIEELASYYYYVRAISSDKTETSNTVSATVPIAPPSTPVLSYSWETEERETVILEWTESISKAGGMATYTLVKGVTGLPDPEVVCITNNLSCKDENPDIKKPFYKVIASNGSGKETESGEVKVGISSGSPVWGEVIPD